MDRRSQPGDRARLVGADAAAGPRRARLAWVQTPPRTRIVAEIAPRFAIAPIQAAPAHQREPTHPNRPIAGAFAPIGARAAAFGAHPARTVPRAKAAAAADRPFGRFRPVTVLC